MLDIETKAHDLALALATSYATAKLTDEVARLSKNGIEHRVLDCNDFFENYISLYDHFKEMLSECKE